MRFIPGLLSETPRGRLVSRASESTNVPHVRRSHTTRIKPAKRTSWMMRPLASFCRRDFFFWFHGALRVPDIKTDVHKRTWDDFDVIHAQTQLATLHLFYLRVELRQTALFNALSWRLKVQPRTTPTVSIGLGCTRFSAGLIGVWSCFGKLVRLSLPLQSTEPGGMLCLLQALLFNCSSRFPSVPCLLCYSTSLPYYRQLFNFAKFQPSPA